MKGIVYKNPRSAAAEEGLIRLICLDPALFRYLDGPNEEDFSSPELWRIFSALRRRISEGESLSPAAMSGELSPDELSLMTGIMQKPESAANGARALADYIGIMRAERSAPPPSEEGVMEMWERMKKEKRG